MLIYQTKNFRVEAPELPLVDSEDGGHVVIDPVIKIIDRLQLTSLVMAGAVVTKSFHKISIDEMIFFVSTIATLLFFAGYGYTKTKSTQP